jgi:hypothetical protein
LFSSYSLRILLIRFSVIFYRQLVSCRSFLPYRAVHGLGSSGAPSVIGRNGSHAGGVTRATGARIYERVSRRAFALGAVRCDWGGVRYC